MTTIVAVVKDGVVALAADTLTSYGDSCERASMMLDGSCKILQISDCYLATTGPAVMNLALQDFFLKYPILAHNYESIQSVYVLFQKARVYMEENSGLVGVEDTSDAFRTLQTEILLATPDGLYGVFPLGAVVKYKEYIARGSGAEYALGSLHATYGYLDAEESALLAVEAGCSFDLNSSAPVDLFTIDRTKKNKAP